VGSKFHHFALRNVSEFWFTPSFGMPHHHLHEEKKLQGSNPRKNITRGVNRTKKITEE
jgi:hypothetical protein